MVIKKSGIFLVILLLFAWQKPVFAGLSGWHGFAEGAFGGVISKGDPTKHSDYNMAEERLQLKNQYNFEGEDILSRFQGVFRFKGDFTLDEYFGGKTDFELREANLSFTPTQLIDVKVGRQVLTWGTGDYLFINDVFPKDYVSFYVGRDDEYLKKPSDALKISLYPELFNFDFIVIPHFTPNSMPEGDRLSFFDSFQGGIAGTDSDRDLIEPGQQAKNFEYAGRFYRNFGSTEAAIYLFRGFDNISRSYKNEAARQLYYERQDVYGSSLRGELLGGIGNIEGAYLHSPEDPKGNNRLIENSSVRLMAGYEKDLGNDLKVAFQYYYEQMLDYAAYKRSLLSQDVVYDECKHITTQRLTKLFKNQTVRVSLFNFYSPSNNDGYLRFSVEYDLTDHWKFTSGLNIPWGAEDYTDFGQMRKNKNIYARLRYSF
ncbi:MAG: hypothetical protein PHC37_00740 [Candidatus Omnitrophica bacterium]|nr:hypothetical protein [Candidatus Omnitrophota bacterium]MDD5690219.1 hypothetical protein [Candidatus Omnitrophota bacterium]